MTPRFVRPAFLHMRSPGRTPKSMSALQGSGYIEGDLTLRTPLGIVSRPITIRAGAHNIAGDTDATISIPRGFVVELYTAKGDRLAPPEHVASITITPTNEA